MPSFVGIQFVECIPAKAQPRGVGIVDIHHVAPNLEGQVIARFLFPRYLFDLQPSAVCRKKDRSAEIKTDRNVALVESLEVLCDSHIEIERARHLKTGRGAATERTNHEVCIGPEHAVQGLAPLCWFAEEIG